MNQSKFTLPELNSSLFTYELWGSDNSILLDNVRLKNNAIGYCEGGKTIMRPKANEYAVMIEEEEQYNVCSIVVKSGELVKYWIHLQEWQMSELFGVEDSK